MQAVQKGMTQKRVTGREEKKTSSLFRKVDMSWHLKRIGNGGRMSQENESTTDGIGFPATTAGKYKSGKPSILTGIK